MHDEDNDIVGIQIIVKTYKKPKKKEEAHTLYHYNANIVITSNRYNQGCQCKEGLRIVTCSTGSFKRDEANYVHSCPFCVLLDFVSAFK